MQCIRHLHRPLYEHPDELKALTIEPDDPEHFATHLFLVFGTLYMFNQALELKICRFGGECRYLQTPSHRL